MAKVNRYSNIVQPTVVNPISFEEFARVPMARAQEKAAGLEATSGISTEFNVDQADLQAVTNATQAIDAEKNTLIDNIVSNGVNNETINDFLRIKNIRDNKYKSFIDKAQTNKQAIDTWRATVDGMVVSGKISPQFGETIKDKEYSKWSQSGATLRPNGQVETFTPSYGVGYVNTDKDIQQVMSQAVMDHADVIEEKGLSTRWIAGNLIITDASGIDVTENHRSLAATIKILESDYSDPSTERGAFAEYTNMNKEDLSDKINNYMDVYKKRIVKPWGGKRQTIRPTATRSSKVQGNPYVPLNKLPGVEISHSTTLEANKGDVSSLVETAFKNPEIANKINKPSWWDIIPGVGGLLKAYEVGQDLAIGNTEDRYKIANNYMDYINILVDDGKISGDLKKKFLAKDSDAIYDMYDIVQEGVSDLSNEITTADIFAGDHTRATYFGDDTKKKPEDVNKDLGYTIHNRPIYKLNDRGEAISNETTIKELGEALLSQKASVTGSLPGGSPVTTDSNGNFNPELSQALIVSHDGEDYIVGRYGEFKDPQVGAQFSSIREIETAVMDAPVGIPVPLYVTIMGADGKVSFQNAQYKKIITRDPDSYEPVARPFVFIQTEGGTLKAPLHSVIGRLKTPDQIKGIIKSQ